MTEVYIDSVLATYNCWENDHLLLNITGSGTSRRISPTWVNYTIPLRTPPPTPTGFKMLKTHLKGLFSLNTDADKITFTIGFKNSGATICVLYRLKKADNTIAHWGDMTDIFP